MSPYRLNPYREAGEACYCCLSESRAELFEAINAYAKYASENPENPGWRAYLEGMRRAAIAAKDVDAAEDISRRLEGASAGRAG